MAISIDGSNNTIGGLAVGGLPNGIVDADMLASDAVIASKIDDAAITAAKLASGVGGKILQVKQAVKTDTATTSTVTFGDVSGLSVSITPTSTSNKILVSCNLYVSGTSNSFVGFKVLRDSTALGLGTEASGNRTNVSMAIVNLNASSSAYGLVNASFEFLDTPSSTSSLTYKLQWSSTLNSYAVYINRPLVTNENRAMEMYTSSQITVKEVAP